MSFGIIKTGVRGIIKMDKMKQIGKAKLNQRKDQPFLEVETYRLTQELEESPANSSPGQRNSSYPLHASAVAVTGSLWIGSVWRES